MSVYFDIFSNWGDVQNNFDMSEPEPDVLFAAYEYENYSGEALVLFKRDGDLWMVEAGHCSCYGLEEMWDPEQATPQQLRHMVNASHDEWLWPIMSRHKQALLKVCDLLESSQ
jgi:hypothetical protein